MHLAVKLWGEPEEIKQIETERKEKEEAKVKKGSKIDNLINELGGFFAFSNDQFMEGYAKIVKAGFIEQGEKVTHVKAGLYLPSKNVDQFVKSI